MEVPAPSSWGDNLGLRVLLVAPHDSYRIVPYLNAARRLGVDTLIASQGRYYPVGSAAEGLYVDLGRPEAALRSIIEAARRRPFAGVIGSDDATAELASRVAQALGVPSNPPEAVLLTRRKDLGRARLKQAGVPVPAHRRVDLAAPLAPQLDGLCFPCVVKPLAMSASRGVIRVDDVAELQDACRRIAAIVAQAPDPEERGQVLVETFIPGREVALEGMLEHGELRPLALFDKPDPLDGPYFEETYYVTPSRLHLSLQDRIVARVQQACAAYGLRHGPVHAELRVNEQDIWILEVAGRTIGGECARLLRFGTGATLEELVLAQAIGRPLAVDAGEGAAGVLMIPTHQAGVLRRVEGVLAAQKLPFIEEVVISVREGYELVPLPEGSSYLGFIFARAPTAAEAERALRAAHACLNVVVAPLWRAALRPRG